MTKKAETDKPERPFIIIEFAGEDTASLRVTPSITVTTAQFQAAAMYMFAAALHSVFQSITQAQVAQAQQQAMVDSIVKSKVG